MSLQIYDCIDANSYFSDLKWGHSSNAGDADESVAATLNEIYSVALDEWVDKSFFTTSQNDLKHAVERIFSTVEQIVGVTLSEREKGGSRILEVWIALSENTPEIRESVYDAEDMMMDRFPERYIEFHVFKEDPNLPTGHFEALSSRRK